MKGIYKFLFHFQATGVENVPDEGPVIICTNHISNFDPPTVGIYLPRRIHFMAKAELFRIPLLGFIIRVLGAFPVKRGGVSREAIRTTLQMLKEGKMLGIFPEGSRNSAGMGQRGAASFALKSKAVVVPAAIIGSYAIFRSTRIVFGKPVDLSEFAELSSSESLEQATEKIMAAIRSLQEGHRPA